MSDEEEEESAPHPDLAEEASDTHELPEEHEEPLNEHVEETMEAMEAAIQGLSYPTNTTELRSEYALSRDDLPNETETMGDVFDRLEPEDYETPEDVREAVLGELTGRAGAEHGDEDEYNPERELEELESTEGEEGRGG